MSFHLVNATAGIASNSAVAADLAVQYFYRSSAVNTAKTKIIICCDNAVPASIVADSSMISYSTRDDWYAARTDSEWLGTGAFG